MERLGTLAEAMTAYFTGDVKQIHHFLKVYALATTLGELEGLEEETMEIIRAAALTHDIGIKNSRIKYASSSGHYQQLEGPPEAEAMLGALGFRPEVISRVAWLIAHHHTYDSITGIDYQILVEADFLVNIQEEDFSPEAISRVESTIFKTSAGKRLLRLMYPAE